MTKIGDTLTYYQDLQKGRGVLQNKRLAVCVLARNCEKNIAANLRRLQKLKKHCADLRLYVIENDSSDNTRSVLQKYAHSTQLPLQLYDADICKEAYAHFVGGALADFEALMHSNDRLLTESRMKRMALLRDGLLYAVKKDSFSPDVLVQLDIDVHWFDIQGIMHSFAHYDAWEALHANGRNFTFCRYHVSYNLFFDTYALLPYNTERTGRFIPHVYNQYVYAPLGKRQPLYPVHAACGGLSLQKYLLIANESYYKSGESCSFECCEHVSWYETLRKKYTTRIYINPSLMVHYNAFWKSFVYAVGVKKILYGGALWRYLIKTLRVFFLPLIYALKLFVKRKNKKA